jgi:hypothetical protein
MACALENIKVKGKIFEKRITHMFQGFPNEFEAEHVGRPWDGGVDVKVRLFGELRTVQCAHWDQRTFSFSKLFEKLRRSQIGVFLFEGCNEPLVIVKWSVWRDHITWEKPGREHSRPKFRGYLATKGLSPREIEEACRLI